MPTVPGSPPQRRFKSQEVGGQRTARRSRCARLRRGLMKQIIWRPIGSLKPFPKNPRRHPEAQIAA